MSIHQFSIAPIPSFATQPIIRRRVRPLKISGFILSLVITFMGIHTGVLSQEPTGRFEWISPRFSMEPFSAARRIGPATIEVYSPGGIISSTDRGVTWSRHAGDRGIDTMLMQATWLDDSHGWGTMYGPYFYTSDTATFRTRDGGATWEIIPLPMPARQFQPMTWNDAFIIDDRNILHRTTDGGSSWEPVDIEQGLRISTCRAIAPNLAFVGGTRPGEADSNVVLRTTDRGITWERVAMAHGAPADSGGIRFSGLSFPDTLSGIAYRPGNRLFRTMDGGRTWEPIAPVVAQSKSDTSIAPELRSIAMADESTGWALGDFDEIFATSDGGHTWSVQDTGTAPTYAYIGGNQVLIRFPTLYAITAIDNRHAVCTGLQGQLLVMTGGSGKWRSANTPVTGEFLTSVAFPEARTGWVGGIRGGIFYTNDGGMSWERQNAANIAPVTDIRAVDRSTAWASVAGGVYRTVDGGANWQYVPVPGFPVDSTTYAGITFYYGIQALSMVDHTHGWAVGVRGAVFSTTDGGIHWSACTPLPQKPYYLAGVSFVDHTTGWIVGEEGAVLRTTDGGGSWELQPTGDTIVHMTSALQPLNDVSFLDRDHGIVVGNRGRVFVTSDGGATWTRGTGPGITNDHGYSAAAYISPSLIWSGGSYQGSVFPLGTVSTSADGIAWNAPVFIFPGSIGPVNACSFPDSDHGYFVGKDGAILRYTGGESSAAPIHAPPPGDDGVRIYPNPTTATLVIDVAERQTVMARVFTLRGEEVAAARPISADGRELSIDMARMVAGMYIIHIELSGKVLTRTIVVR